MERINKNRMNLLWLGAYVKDRSSLIVRDKGIIEEQDSETSIWNDSVILGWTDESSEDEFSKIWDDFSEIYDQYISELENSRKFIMNPYDDFRLYPEDYILCLGKLDLETISDFIM